MREYRDYFGSDESRTPPLWLGLSSATLVLIVANTAIYLAYTIGVYFVLPTVLGVHRPPDLLASEILGYVGLDRSAFLHGSVWQLLTFQFVHRSGDWLHLAFNMLCLYFFGRELETLYGVRRFLSLYLAAGLCTGVVHLALGTSVLVGASGPVYAVMVAYAFHYPRQRVLLLLVPLEVRLLAVLLIGLDAAMWMSGGAGASVAAAHLAGAAFGAIVCGLEGRLAAHLARLRSRVRRGAGQHEEEIEARLDTLLEKISRAGLSSLTKKERDFLKRASRHYQRKS